MALHGNLKDFSVSQLLNLVNLSRKSGTLVVTGSSGTACLAFEKGKLAFAQVGQNGGSLSKILLQKRKIGAGLFEHLRGFGPETNDKEIGLYLVSGGFVTRAEITALMKQHYRRQIQELFRWEDGTFQFSQNENTPDEIIPVRINLEDLILEDARQSTQDTALLEELPDLDIILKFPEKPRADIKRINLSREEWRVISFVNPANTVRKIAAAAGMSESEIRKVVFSLLQASVVEVVRCAPQPKPGIQTRKLTQPEIEEQKSLVTRIIGRLRPDKG